MAAEYKLTYLNGRGRGEIIRLILTYAGEPFEDIRVTREEVAEMRQNLPFGHVPILEFKGKTMCQSMAISRYLARKFDLAGKTEEEIAEADMIVECMKDAIKPGTLIRFSPDSPQKEEQFKKYKEQDLPTCLTRLEKLLIANNGGDGYFVGNSLTWADLFIIRAYGFWDGTLGIKAPFAKHSKLDALYRRVISLPRIAEYLAKAPVTPF